MGQLVRDEHLAEEVAAREEAEELQRERFLAEPARSERQRLRSWIVERRDLRRVELAQRRLERGSGREKAEPRVHGAQAVEVARPELARQLALEERGDLGGVEDAPRHVGREAEPAHALEGALDGR